ncbi:Lrp/AsnC family transcriptional regulator [Actinoplanes awajinensis]|uniref:Transcriptional regulator n=1 Tax=Actinoplanes awajinensis subsp. mycoplanecinus TaxID=135947 RepID=A0A101JF54_9ACTN|nr:Lrp/AsnC family transcriptional regulator [Actinoplanes awajinensis]KUL25670.1 transcriptional regulator [Actinoplanes awajinensis subsp. mycoplanecinus]
MEAPEIADSMRLEPEDVRIIRALQIDPRVGFATVGAVLGISELTVARRYRRMCRAGVLRVVGVVDPGALGQSQWMVRLRCRPGSGTAIAEALAERDDVSWVTLAAGGSEVTCAVRSRTAEQRDDLLGRRLPRASAVLDLQAAVQLRQFVAGRGHYWVALTGVLTPEQETALGATGLSPFVERPIVRDPPATLSAPDDTLLAALAADGRASLVDLAAATGLTTGRVSRRMQALLAAGVLYLDVEIAPLALGYRARAILALRVHPAQLTAVGRALAAMPEVAFAAAVSGRDNLHAVVHCADLDRLFVFTTERVGALPGVETMAVSLTSRQVKQVGTRVDGGRLT